jgi:xanthine/CO dehydrogenase XdhC/CoxF family maturation factor
MIHWQETARLLRRLDASVAAGRRAVLATVVHIVGSVYRRPGAKLLIADDGTMQGSVSGGCLEADVREHALNVLRTGIPRLLHYDTGTDDTTPFGLGLGCNGTVDVFVQPADTPSFCAAASRISALLQGDHAFCISTVIADEKPERLGALLVSGTNGKLTGTTGDAAVDRAIITRAAQAQTTGVPTLADVGHGRVFLDVLTPPPELLVFGGGADAPPLARFATEAGFRVAVVDHRPAYLDASRYPAGTTLIEARWDTTSVTVPLGTRTHAVVMTHSITHDREWVRRLLGSPVAYIGLLGPRARLEDILRQIDVPGDDRLFGPVGLDLGAEGPEQIALSVVAELLGVWSRREPGHLRERQGVIHAG